MRQCAGLDFVHLRGVGEDVGELSVNCGWGFSAVGVQPRQWNMSVGQPQHEVRRFGHVSNFCAKSSRQDQLSLISPTWRKAQLLLVGAILTPGQRTVAAALRVMGLSDDRNYARYHEVLHRAVWSSCEAARILLLLLLQHLNRGDGPLIFGIDETLERCRGAKIRARAIYRDPVRSSRNQLVKASGLRWISLMWLGQVPWAGRHWALPVLTVLAPSSRYHQQ